MGLVYVYTGKVVCDGLACHPGGVDLLDALCYGTRDKLRPVEPVQWLRYMPRGLLILLISSMDFLKSTFHQGLQVLLPKAGGRFPGKPWFNQVGIFVLRRVLNFYNRDNGADSNILVSFISFPLPLDQIKEIGCAFGNPKFRQKQQLQLILIQRKSLCCKSGKVCVTCHC